MHLSGTVKKIHPNESHEEKRDWRWTADMIDEGKISCWGKRANGENEDEEK